MGPGALTVSLRDNRPLIGRVWEEDMLSIRLGGDGGRIADGPPQQRFSENRL